MTPIRFCDQCGTKMVRCENVAEHHDEFKCPKCGHVEPIEQECDGMSCRGLG